MQVTDLITVKSGSPHAISCDGYAHMVSLLRLNLTASSVEILACHQHMQDGPSGGPRWRSLQEEVLQGFCHARTLVALLHIIRVIWILTLQNSHEEST